jgi:hypothetical protein
MTMASDSAGERHTTVQFGPLRLDYVITLDEFDGTPILPGFATDEIFWGLVARLPGGRTLWRSVALVRQASIPEAAP